VFRPIYLGDRSTDDIPKASGDFKGTNGGSPQFRGRTRSDLEIQKWRSIRPTAAEQLI